jgi:hypothetical protein
VSERRESPWNRCAMCGRFIPYIDFDSTNTEPGTSLVQYTEIRHMVQPGNELSPEIGETLCKSHIQEAQDIK